MSTMNFLKKILSESYSSFLSEGKHWPEDYKKTALNMIKASPLGQTSWYNDSYQKKDVDTIVNEFRPLSHKNSNLGYFSPIIRWFLEYAESNQKKYKEFLETKLDGIIQTLLYISNNQSEESKIKDDLKTKWTFSDFEKFQKEIQSKIDAQQQEKSRNLSLQDKGYEIIPIESYEELHEKFGGDVTGYNGESEWCHSNGKSTYNSWTDNGTKMFFVIAKKNWEKIYPPDPETTNAYDDYGTSLIAILVQITNNKLLKATLRWNHIIDPSKTKPGTSVDKAFLGWADLAEVTGRDVEHEIAELNAEKVRYAKEAAEKANKKVAEILNGLTEINENIIKKELRKQITKVDIPDSVTNIGGYSFEGCSNLESISIPNTVTFIGISSFYGCTNLKSINIPYSVKQILSHAFERCTSLTSIVIPDSVMILGQSAFYGCSSLKSVKLSKSLTGLSEFLFMACHSLESIEIPDTIEYMDSNIFIYCENLKTVKLPKNLTKIPAGTFSYCSSLKTIEIPNSVTKIGFGAFSECQSLESIVIPESVTTIEGNAFHLCRNLKSIVLPSSLEKIDYEAFGECNPNLVVTVPHFFDRKLLRWTNLPETTKFKVIGD